MAMGTGGDRRMMSERNVTPLVDVMLVLLIVFMVTAPMLQSGIDVQLPTAGTAPLDRGERAVTITVDRKGMIHLNKHAFTLDDFRKRVRVRNLASAFAVSYEAGMIAAVREFQM